MPELEADALMRSIEARAAQAGPEPSFPQLQLQQLLPELRERRRVEPRPLLIGRTAYERLWVRINRLLRRVSAHAVEPAVTQQNEFNVAAEAALEALIETDAALRAAVIRLRAERAAQERHDGR